MYPNEKDSDGDGLDDGVEYLRLGTNPLAEDSDGDGIYDNVEVGGFSYNEQDWFLDPNAADTNNDSRLDTVECPDLVAHTHGGDYTCLDQDADGTPDVFDRDDDGDGVADRIDLFPDGLVDRDGAQTNGLNLSYFDGDNPFQFKVGNLQQDQPVFVDFQMIPENADHLTYALNVLDWPASDTDGQVQHVKHTTFASSLTEAQKEVSPSAANGDMRLIPMLEIVMTGNQIPMPLTAPVRDVPLEGLILGNVRMEQNASDTDSTDFVFSFDDPIQDYTIKIYAGNCPASGTPLTTRSNVGDGDTILYGHRIVDVADGDHAITISDGTDAICSPLGNIVNGPYQNKMIDPAFLEPYGITVREINANGKLAAYIPLNLVPDETGSGRAAFSARMAYQLGNSANWQKEQEVRVVWLVQMLTDHCDTSGFTPIVGEAEDAANARLKTWCADPANRTPDANQIVQTYPESWALTGLSVREDHGLDTAIIYEDLTNGDVENSENLWQAARSLSAVFLAGRNENGDNYRDVSIYINDQDGDRIGNSNLFARIDADGSVPDGDERRWGIAQGTLQVERERYDHQDYGAYQAMTATPDILANFPHDAVPTLLFAREEHFRSADLHAISLNSGVFSVDMSAASHPQETITGLRWMPYRYNSDTDPDGQVIGWEPYPATEYWDQLEIQFTDIFAQIDPDLDEAAHLGQAVVARAYYLSLMQGLAQQVQSGNNFLWVPDPSGDDGDAALAAKITIGGYGKKFSSIIFDITKDFLEEYGRFEFVEVAFDRFNGVWTATYEEIHGFWYSIGKSIKGNTVGPWMQMFSGGVKSKIGAGIALVGGVATIGLTLFAVSQQSNPMDIAEVVLAGLSVVMAIQGMVSTVVRVVNDAKVIATGLSAAARNGLSSAGSSIKNAFKSAAVVGLIIGVVITWGALALQIGLQAGLGGGISRMALANAIAGAIGATIVAVIMFAIAAIPVVGWIIAAVIGLIDAIVSLLCTIFLSDEQAEHAAAQWFCGGLTGIVSRALSVLIYSGNVMVELFPEDYNRLEFSNFEADDLVHPELGIVAGNKIRYGVSITNTIDIAPLPDNLGAAYRYQYNDGNLKTSTFDYQLSYTNTTEIHEDLDRKTMTSEWQYADGDGPEWGDFGHTWRAAEPVYIERTVASAGVELTTAGINLPTTLYLTEGYAIPSQNCILGICTIWTERGSEHFDLGSGILFDVFPAALDGFYELAAKGNGYALAWGQTGSDTFPRLQDADGDGIPYNIDQHDNFWDNDGDGLSDGDETRLGSNPNNPDSDSDGLRDDLELIAETNPLRPDSDGDGLLDSEEVFHQDIFDQDGDGNTAEWLGGWEFVYALATDGTPLETWVIPSPLSTDSDGDNLSDFQEKTYGMNPQWISNPSVLTFESTIQEADGGGYTESDGFVQPGDTLYYEATLQNELFNRWAHGLLGTDFPGELSNANLSPQPFLLYPQEQQTLAGEVPVGSAAASGVYSLTQTAGALISDWSELSQNASLWFPFEDDIEAVTFADRSGNIPAHDGICSDPVPGSGCAAIKDDGAFGGSLQFDGTASIASDYDPSDSAFAISLWFKTTEPDGGLFEIPGFWDRWLYLKDGNIKARIYAGGSHQILTSAQTYHDGKWHHIVHTFGGAAGGQKLYVDGLRVDSGSYTAARANTNGIRLGYANISGVGYFNGKIDDVRIFDKGLSHAEIQVIFDTPVLDLRFNGDSGWRDSSPFRNNATCTNCPTHPEGIDGNAAGFNGLSYLTIGPDDSLDLSEGQFTIGVWIRPGDSPEYCHEREWLSPTCVDWQPQPQGILGLGSGGSNAYPSLQRVGQKLRFTFGDNEYFTTADVLQNYKWNHVTVTFDGTSLKIYVNGQLVAEDATIFNGQAPPARSTLTVGRSGTRGTFTAKKIRVEEVGEGENTGEMCMAFKSGDSQWFSILDQDIDEGLVDGNYLPLLININSTPRGFWGDGQLLMWENDSGQRCVTDENKNDTSPVDGTDDFLGQWFFSSDWVSKGFDGSIDENFAVANYSGPTNGFFYYVYENDSILFQGRIDELQIYNRTLDDTSVEAMYQSHRKALNLKFDDAPGTTSFADSSFDPREATCSGEGCPIAGLPGRVNQSALFDGGDSLSLGQSELNRFTNEFTVAAWVKPEDLNGLQWIAASARTNSANGYGFALHNDGLRFQIFGLQTYNWPAAGLEAGQWAHIAAVMDEENNVSFYLNGTFLGEVTGTSPANADTEDVFLIGATTYSGSSTRREFFTGEIDDLYIFSNALGESRIQNLYNDAPILQLHLDQGEQIPNGARFADSARIGSADCQGTHCPAFGFAIDGQLSTSVEFDGVNDFLEYPDQAFMDLDAFTLSAWVKPTQAKEQWQTIVTRGAYPSTYGLFIAPNSMAVTFAKRPSSCYSAQILESENPLIQNVWNHLVATFDGAVMQIYINGQLQGSLAASGGVCHDFDDPLRIGYSYSSYSDGSAAFSGRIDEVTLYDHALAWTEIAATFNYQGKWVEERQSHNITVDAEAPNVSLNTTGDNLPFTDVQMLITASDPASGIAKVELGVRMAGAPNFTWQTAPPCQDAFGEAAWCPTFVPSAPSGYTLRARATDLVGHVSAVSTDVLVENVPPAAAFDFAASQLISANRANAQPHTWLLSLLGTVSDPSGVDADSLMVTLLDENGLIAGPGAQRAALDGTAWSVDYLLDAPDPSGEYTVQLVAADLIAARPGLDDTHREQHTRTLEQSIQVDAAAALPYADLDGLPLWITDTLPIS